MLRRRALGRAIRAAATSTNNTTRPFSSSSSTNNPNANKAGGIGGTRAAGALLAVLAAADLGYPHYQQAEADRRAAAALLKGGAALTASVGTVSSSAVVEGKEPIPITIESANQQVKVVVVEKGNGNGHCKGGSGNGGRFLPREALQRRVQGALAPRSMGRGGYVVLKGPKGSGKTAAVREAARAEGARVLYINLAAPSTDPNATGDAEAAVRRALGLDSLPVHPPYHSLLGLAYGAAVRGLEGAERQGGKGEEEEEEVASVRRALRLLQRALVKAQQQAAGGSGAPSPPPTIVIDHLDALRSPEAVALVQDWAVQATTTEQPPLASTVAVVAGEGTPALATMMGRAAWAGVAGRVEVPDLTEAEALAYLHLAAPPSALRPSDARRLVALLGGRLAHLRRAVAGLSVGGKGSGGKGAGIEDVALEACEGMRAGYDRLMSLPAAAFLPSSPTTLSPPPSGCCRHKGAVAAGWSAFTTGGMHALLAALLHSPTKTLPLPAAAKHLSHPTTHPRNPTTDIEIGLAHRLLFEGGAGGGNNPVLTLLPPTRAGDPPRVAFASPLAEKFGYAYLSAYRHASSIPAEALVAAALAAERAAGEGDDEEGKKGKKKRGAKGGGGGFPGLVSTALLAASAALYLAATGVGGGRSGDGACGGGGGYRGVYLALPQAADMEALTKAAQGAVRASAAATKECARAVAGRLAAASHAVGEALAAVAAATAGGAGVGSGKGSRGGGGLGGAGGGSTQV